MSSLIEIRTRETLSAFLARGDRPGARCGWKNTPRYEPVPLERIVGADSTRAEELEVVLRCLYYGVVVQTHGAFQLLVQFVKPHDVGCRVF